MLRNSPFAVVPIYKIVVGLSLCTLGGAMLYSYFKSRDDEDNENTAAAESRGETKKAKSKEKEVCIKMVVANDCIPLIIGRGGANLKLIEEKTNTKIRLRDKDSEHKFCDINGYRDKVLEARTLLLKEIDRAPVVKEVMLVSPQFAQKLNERGGETIQEICRNSLAKVSLDNSGRNGKVQLTIVGNQKQVNLARKFLDDKMEADEELRLDVEEVEQKREPRRSPTSSMNSSLYSSQNSLSSHLPPREKMLAARNDEKSMEVYVSAVASPSKFWVQLIGPQTIKLEEMVKEMTVYYGNEENRARHKITEPYVGQIVAGLLKYDAKWYRAEIVDIVQETDLFQPRLIDLYFVDYGDSEYVELRDIYELRTDFLTLRFQAVECFLANVKPPPIHEPHVWPRGSNITFEELTDVASWKRLNARVVTYKERAKPLPGINLNSAARDGAPVPGIELFDTTDGAFMNIGNVLIATGFASPLDDYVSHSRSYTPTSHSSDSTIEELVNVNIENNHQAEEAHFENKVQDLQTRRDMYLNNDKEVAAAPAENLIPVFHKGSNENMSH